MKRISKEAPELDITAFLNLMVVLVPFLLITAVFSRITVLQINLPEAAGAQAAADLAEDLNIEVVLRSDRVIVSVSAGDDVLANVYPNLPEEIPGERRYDWQQVNDRLSEYKSSLPDKTDAIILMEKDIKYDYMVQAMDNVQVQIRSAEDGSVQIYQLFPDVSFGDAPEEQPS